MHLTRKRKKKDGNSVKAKKSGRKSGKPLPFLLRAASDCVSVSVLGCSLDGEKAMGKRSGKAGASEDFTSSLSASESGCEEPREHFLSHLRQFMESRGFVHCP